METEFRIGNKSQLTKFEQKNIEPRTIGILVWYEQQLEKAEVYAEPNIDLEVKKYESRTDPYKENWRLT